MSALTESSSPKGGLYCELCDDIQFLTYADWQIHHLHHLRQPFVQLVKLNRSLCEKLLQGKSYRVNTGVARSSQHHIPPLKISFIKRGHRTFSVKKEEISSNCNSVRWEDATSEGDSRGSGDELKPKPVHEGPSEVEGKELLERLGASFSISRKVKPYDSSSIKSDLADAGQNPSASSQDGKKDNILERLSGIGGISISSVSKSPTVEAKPSCGVSISSKRKSLELSELKLLKEKLLENEKKAVDKNKILEKLTVSGLIAKVGGRGEEQDGRVEETIKVKNEEALKGESLERPRLKSNKSDDSNDSTDSRVSGESRTGQVNSNEENGKTACENTVGEQKKFVRVKRSSFKKSMRPRREGSNEETSEEKASTEEGREKDSAGETGIVILERLTENLSNTVGAEKSAEAANSSQSNSVPVEDPLAVSTGIGELNSDIHASSDSECPQSSESQFQIAGEKNLQEQEQGDMLLTSPVSEQNGKSSSYNSVGQNQQEPYVEHMDEGHNESNENPVSFSSLSNENQSEDQGEQQTAFWSDIQNSTANDNQPQEDPLLTPDNSVTDGDSNFLHSFSSEYQTPQGNLPPENSEFMSLDRLGHTQHRQSPYGSDPTSPMEHLSQQVQRLPNPTPQINVISPHHLQAPHPGVPQPPQQPNPQQLLLAGNDALHMQPPLPPPLYQGYMYNQNYPPQPQIPRAPQPQMPMLQQRPNIPTRTFQPMPVPQQRPRARPAVKRKVIRPPHDMLSTAKQPRMTSPSQISVRPQVPNLVAKPPSGTTVSHPKALEASKVANVLASRGITVTPSRQTNQSARPQQQRPQSSSSSSVRNVGSAVSITSSNQNRNSGGFAVPSPRRSAPIVNHNAERPERCMTVDLTQDEELPSSQVRSMPTAGRFPCELCGKVFGSSSALRAHKNYHSNTLAFKCDLCSMQFNTMAYLMNHRRSCHKKAPAPDLAIPIVDLNHPGARDQLRKCGVYNFIPLAQLQSNNNGYFGVPIIQLDTAKEKAVSNLSLIGAGNILVLGKMKAITPQTGR